jgi:two-component system cell cycle response regulator
MSLMMPRAAPGRSLAPPKGIMEERRLRHYLRSLAIKVTDELTGLYNRRYLLSSLDELIDRVGRDETSAAVLFDIDHFKLINDTHGHVVGDGLANRTLNSVRSVDLVARFGGEEFVIVMPETDLLTASRRVRRPQPSGTTPNGRQS